ncbi:MAG: hypothetical protein ACM3TR_09890 [Caulobacteraceae bacterium]
MSPRRRSTPMKYWGFYASAELKEETIKCAIAANEDNSEYIRKAIEMRNAQYNAVNTVTAELSEEPIGRIIEKVKEQQKGGPIEKPKKEVQTFFKK